MLISNISLKMRVHILRLPFQSQNFTCLASSITLLNVGQLIHFLSPSFQENNSYGGCEGPNAMYVKLISSDGHEFIVKREHALTSGTIKAMLSGPGQFAENETNEVNFREIP
jgi:hypothetical protein